MNAVPTGVPLNVSGSAINSTAIVINWKLPAPEDRNGNITGYSLIIEEVDTNVTTTYNTVLTQLIVAFLQPYSDYKCQIAAETSVGTGPYGDAITIRTLPDGKLN